MANVQRVKEIQAVYELGEKIGYGNLMDIVSALWTKKMSEDGTTRIMALPIAEAFIIKEAKTIVLDGLDARLEELRELGM